MVIRRGLYLLSLMMILNLCYSVLSIMCWVCGKECQ